MGRRCLLIAAAIFVAAPFSVSAQISPEMVSRTAFRVCEDADNMPFANRAGEGFENKIAELVASEVKLPLRYFWAPSGPGFIRNTLQSDLCDVVIGYAAGAEIVQHTNPYYRSTYVIVTPKESPLAAVKSLNDPALKGRRIGAFAGTPPVDELNAKGLVDNAKFYDLIVDHRFDSPLAAVVSDLRNKTIDAAIVWGPLIGLSVKKSNGALAMTPLLKEGNQPDYSFRMTFGIRHNEPDWKHKLEAILRSRQADINAILSDYNVPLLDNAGHLISPSPSAAPQKTPAP
jgi:quinoprotein dehydrogenase-associated probable ABC transporter substrate-binding protein